MIVRYYDNTEDFASYSNLIESSKKLVRMADDEVMDLENDIILVYPSNNERSNVFIRVRGITRFGTPNTAHLKTVGEFYSYRGWKVFKLTKQKYWEK